MMRLVVLVTTAVVGLLVTTLLACDSQTVAPTDSPVPVANSVKATQGLSGPVMPITTPNATSSPTLTPAVVPASTTRPAPTFESTAEVVSSSLPTPTDENEGRRLGLFKFLGAWQNEEYTVLDFIASMDPAAGSLDEGVLTALEEMDGSNYVGTVKLLELLISQAWFQDGLSSEEKAFVIALRGIPSGGGYGTWPIGKELVEEGQVWSDTFHATSLGELNLFVVSRFTFPSDDDIFEGLRAGLEAVGVSARQPSETTNVILLVERDLQTCYPQWQIGRNVDAHIGGSRIENDELYGYLRGFYADLIAKAAPRETPEPEPTSD